MRCEGDEHPEDGNGDMEERWSNKPRNGVLIAQSEPPRSTHSIFTLYSVKLGGLSLPNWIYVFIPLHDTAYGKDCRVAYCAKSDSQQPVMSRFSQAIHSEVHHPRLRDVDESPLCFDQ